MGVDVLRMLEQYTALEYHEEIRAVSPGVWEHVFTPPTAASDIIPCIDRIEMILRAGEKPQVTISYRGAYHLTIRQAERLRRLHKIKRRQHRAAYRRRKRGLA